MPRIKANNFVHAGNITTDLYPPSLFLTFPHKVIFKSATRERMASDCNMAN